MEAITLKAQARAEGGKGPARRLRVAGNIPAVLYGSGAEPMPVTVASKDVVGVLQGPYGRNTLLRVEIDGQEPALALIREHQVHPVKRKLVHCDLMRVQSDKPVTVVVPLVTEGKSQAEKLGGRLRMVSREMTVSCLPGNIPQVIKYDVSSLKTGKTIYASEIPLPEAVSAAWRNNFAVISVTAPKGAEGEGE